MSGMHVVQALFSICTRLQQNCNQSLYKAVKTFPDHVFIVSKVHVEKIALSEIRYTSSAKKSCAEILTVYGSY